MSQHLPMERFDRNAKAALGDDNLRRALRHATGLFGERRKAATQTVDDWEGLRAEARAIKDQTLARLDEYLVEFTDHLSRLGAQVHWARDAREGCAIVAQIAARADAKTAVKSKSMTTEEIHLNEALKGAGVEAIETDLGEWIIQLADEVPSHIIVPAIHKTRRDVAELFAECVGSSADDDAAQLAAAARRVLRRKFAAAELGISGVNFGVATTGTILILENEGNARFSTSLPRVHVAVMGIEKLVPERRDLDPFLKLLPRSGTGQRLTSYQSLITGPKRSPDDEGPEELHVVLLDNGRSRMLGHPTTRQSLACIRCGACLNACPVYQQVGGHAYGSVYPGPIGAVITPQLQGVAKARQLPYASSLCGACRDVCPVKIDIPKLLLHLRADVTAGREVAGPESDVPFPKKRGERFSFWMYGWVCRSRLRFEIACRLARIGQRLVARRGRIGKLGALWSRLAPPLGAWTAGRDLRPVASQSFREWWKIDRKERG